MTATLIHREPSRAPRDSAAHLAWRLEGVREEMPDGWFLFDGKQIATIRRALQSVERRV